MITTSSIIARYASRSRSWKQSRSAYWIRSWAGARKRYLQTFACSCRSFAAGRETQLVHTVTRDEVKQWVARLKSPKTQRNYLGDLRECLAWAVRERYLRKNPIAGEEGFIQLTAETDEEISALDLEHCRALLRAALLGVHKAHGRVAGSGLWTPIDDPGGFRPLIGYLAIALFAGVRPEEIKRTPLAKINLRERTIVIMGKSAKTRQRRVIELSRVAVIWLRLWRRICPQQEAIMPRNFVRLWKALRAEAKLGIEWPHDALRHSFATYHYAAHQNVAQLQAQMGHSEREDTLFRHYRAVETLSGHTVTRKMGEEFWRLTPRRVRMGK